MFAKLHKLNIGDKFNKRKNNKNKQDILTFCKYYLHKT